MDRSSRCDRRGFGASYHALDRRAFESANLRHRMCDRDGSGGSDLDRSLEAFQSACWVFRQGWFFQPPEREQEERSSSSVAPPLPGTGLLDDTRGAVDTTAYWVRRA